MSVQNLGVPPPSRKRRGPAAGNRRRHPRVDLNREPLELAVSGSAPIPARVLNLSEGGLAVETRWALPEHARVRFRAPGLALTGFAMVTRCDGVRGHFRSGLAMDPESDSPEATLALERLSRLLEIEILVLSE